MKYKFNGKREVEIGGLGIVQPGQEFDIMNEDMKYLFENDMFSKVDNKKKVEVKKEEVKEVKEE